MLRLSIKCLSKTTRNSSKQWKKRQMNDIYVRMSQVDNYRSRAAYKLLMLQDKYKFIHSNQIILDVGAAPGAWSQIALQSSSPHGIVVSVDRLNMKEITSLNDHQDNRLEYRLNEKKSLFSKNSTISTISKLADLSNKRHVPIGNCDIRKSENIQLISSVIETINRQLFNSDNISVDVILSDICENITGHNDIDYENNFQLQLSVWNFGRRWLKKNGSMLLKLRHGPQLQGDINRHFKNHFTKIDLSKPVASRESSKEIYLLCKNYLKKESL
ncbi:hypothetical protein SNEBB_003957 [Seison nebaliae]|nr:hypothetical protein SNEBB_003957 [Seison nebaliae]